MDKVLELAKQAGAVSYTNRHYPDRPYRTFGPEELERFYELARADLEAEVFRLREHIIDQTKLEQEINQLRKERQAFKDVTEYQKAENAKLTETIKSLNSALTNTSRGNAKLKSAMKNLLWYIGQLEMIAYTNEEGDHEYVEAARAALGEK